MSCPNGNTEIAGRLLEYCAGKLAAEHARRVEAHLGECAACREFAARQTVVWKSLDEWEAPPVSAAEFDRRLYGRIQAYVPWWDRFLRPLRPALAYGVPLTAAAGLVIVATLLSQRPAELKPAPVPESAQVQMETASPEQVQRALDEMEMLRDLNRLVHSDSPESRM